MIAGINQEEILTLKQKLKEGQVKMQSRLEEEEEAKAALVSRIQRLTKLILVPTKNTIPGCLCDIASHQQHHSLGEDEVQHLLVQCAQHLEKGETHQGPGVLETVTHQYYGSAIDEIQTNYYCFYYETIC